ncbi:hypothetical protein GOBAR_AA31004 [Gossypium barbadense]|uniref:Myb/SANT-like domain-containing protein n=1 Tax=Gossypium barbadense TaxID=3634 RepID=A0A2P5WF10_GOSBA|nr:hypothetical protein GOBAR_AA31004 [Gossypium barbadense]
MSGFSQSRTNRKWVPKEDVALVVYMDDLYNVRTYNADTGFKTDYLDKLERMLKKILPHAMLKAKLNLESRIRILKRDWTIVYDMLCVKDNSGFGWDEHRQMVVAEDVVWNSYICSHKAVGQLRYRIFPYYDQFTFIYAKDRAIGKDAQTTTDIVKEIDVEGVTNNLEEGNNYHKCENDVFLDKMDVSATQSQLSKPNQDGSAFSKKKMISDRSEQFSTSITNVFMSLGENMWTIGLELSRSIASEKVLQESAQKLYRPLCEVEGLTKDECYCALSKIPDHPMQILIFLVYLFLFDWNG